MKRSLASVALPLLLLWQGAHAADSTPASPTGAGTSTENQKPPVALVAEPFAALAGSNDNAIALANALRTGAPATLTAPSPDAATAKTTTFSPPTKPMGWGNVSYALEIAQHALRIAGISSPSHADLIAALVGGRVVAVDGTPWNLVGVLRQRAAGMAWGVIARSYGTTLAAFTHGHATPEAMPKLATSATAIQRASAQPQDVRTAATRESASPAPN
ncbi:MAG TPA: hypothetical protein VFN86_08295 [Casimicrobiaceae bacterium]|nr:hypothetical protein [Casimicrobiaceae bacterium]